MAKKYKSNYWEAEEGEIIEFGKHFMRCYDKAGKLQFGDIFTAKETGEKMYKAKFTIDRDEICGSKEGVFYLRGTMTEWQEIYEGKQHED